MFKKFSYLASVSVLASMVMTQAVSAMDPPEKALIVGKKKVVGYQDQTGVLEVIKNFYAPQTQHVAVAPAPQDQDVSAAWGLVSGLGSAIYSVGSVVAKPVGNVMRWTGDQVRGDTFVGDLLVGEALKVGKDVAMTGAPAAHIAELIEKNQGTLKLARIGAGNGIRWFGACLAGETPTLGRAIREFWIENKYDQKPEHALTSTACALYLSDDIRGVDHITEAYREIVETWNSGSCTQRSLDPGVNQAYFLNGITRGYAIKNKPIDDRFKSTILALNVDLGTLPTTKLITSQTVTEAATKEGKPVLANDLPTYLKQARESKLLEYAQEQYVYEMTKLGVNQDRIAPPRAIADSPQKEKVVVPAPVINELGQSLLMAPDEKALETEPAPQGAPVELQPIVDNVVNDKKKEPVKNDDMNDVD